MKPQQLLRTLGFHGAVGAALTIAGMLPGLAQSSAGIPGVVAPGVAVELVQEGFQFTEGPVGTPDGGLYFTDNRANRIHFLDPSGKISTAHENTNNANGLALTRDGDLLEVQGVGKRVNRRSRNGTVTTLSESFEGKPFMAPNDLFADAKGGIYFSDPGPRPVVPGRKAFVYYLPAGAKEPVLIDDQLGRPNGLILTADGKTLLVNDSLSETFYAYDVEPDGKVKNKRPFAKLRDIPAGKESGADGMAIDRDGRVYVTSVPGVQIFDASGQYLGTVQAPRQTSNVAFAGPDKRTLYITAREGLYRLKVLTPGLDRIGK
jgi:gluconolactonase